MIDPRLYRGVKTRRFLVGAIIAALGVLAVATAALVTLILVTSTPDVPPRLVVNPNTQLQAYALNGATDVVAKTNLHYVGVATSQVSAHPCGDSHGYWSLVVNPEDVIGHPYSAMPNASDWSRAADAMSIANAICPTAVTLTWYGHDAKRPALDLWSATVPAIDAASLSGPRLRQYVSRHATQP